jgi:hypothetical protein
MTLAEELMELQNAGMIQEQNQEDDAGLAFDNPDDPLIEQNTKQGQQPLENIFLASGFRRGMR